MERDRRKSARSRRLALGYYEKVGGAVASLVFAKFHWRRTRGDNYEGALWRADTAAARFDAARSAAARQGGRGLVGSREVPPTDQPVDSSYAP